MKQKMGHVIHDDTRVQQHNDILINKNRMENRIVPICKLHSNDRTLNGLVKYWYFIVQS